VPHSLDMLMSDQEPQSLPADETIHLSDVSGQPARLIYGGREETVLCVGEE